MLAAAPCHLVRERLLTLLCVQGSSLGDVDNLLDLTWPVVTSGPLAYYYTSN